VGFKDIPNAPAKTDASNKTAAGVKSTKILSPLSGKVIPLEQVKDEAFSTGVLGKGIAILPDKGVLVSPIDGTVDLLTDTKHSINLAGANGEEILIHIGMDTVGLNGKPFTPKVKEGDTVKAGQTLIEFDIQAIKDAGLDTVTPIVITNSGDYGSIEFTKNERVAAGDILIMAEA
jgi:PTS system beta-glucosides-specific IIC component